MEKQLPFSFECSSKITKNKNEFYSFLGKILFLLLCLCSIPSLTFGQWTAQTSGTSNNLKSVSFVDASNGWATGKAGTILHTSNGGTNWSTQSSSLTSDINGVVFTDVNNGWAVGASGANGKIIHTSNGGTAWAEQGGLFGAVAFGVDFVDANNGWACGNGGILRSTSNGGTNWNTETTGTGNALFGIDFVDANTGWTVGGLGTILKTTNGGTSWTTQTSGSTATLRKVKFADANNGWVTGHDGVILHTSNGGTTWTAQSSGTSETFFGQIFFSANIGWLAGGSGTILYTLNGGDTWIPQTSGTSEHLQGASSVDANNIWIVGNGGTILYSATGGLSGTVTTTDDEINTDGDCSLREMIQAATTNTAVDACPAGSPSATDVIGIPDGTYSLNTVGTEIILSSDITLLGTSQANTIIQAHPTAATATARVFGVTTTGTDVSFQDLTIRHGNPSATGGGVDINLGASGTGSATFTNVTVSQNNGTSGGGIAISDDITTFTMTNCTVSNNTSTGNGGAIQQVGAVNFTLTDCLISGNSSGSYGGGVNISENSSTNTFTRCSITGNMLTTNQSGAGLNLSLGNFMLTNCTISGNTGANKGGGIAFASNEVLSIYNSTIVNNSVNSSNEGGGIRMAGSTTTHIIVNSIVANNTANGVANDVDFNSIGSFGTNTTNLVETCSGTCPSWSYTADPNLAAAATCGSTPAMTYFQPQSPSNALNNGTAPSGNIPTDDICGSVRNAGVYDIGSYDDLAVALPIELTDFRGQVQNGKSLLTWKTASETNNEGFEIEWTTNNEQWENIGFVKGAGSSYDLQSYQFTHDRPVSGINYYRLKQIDFDGAFEYSNVVSVQLAAGSKQLAVYPNPTQNGSFTLYLPENEAATIEMTMYDYTGRLVRELNLANIQTEVNVSDLEKGIYLIQVDMDGLVSWERVVIQ